MRARSHISDYSHKYWHHPPMATRALVELLPSRKERTTATQDTSKGILILCDLPVRKKTTCEMIEISAHTGIHQEKIFPDELSNFRWVTTVQCAFD